MHVRKHMRTNHATAQMTPTDQVNATDPGDNDALPPRQR